MRYDNWVAKGSKDMTARANERARKLLAEHEVPPLPAAAEEIIQEILQRRGS
jgi:trimethylamine--corrinoid protein Co-methyltransferase